MAKRFTDTELWDKEWFMKLDCRLKCLVKFVRDKADLSGVWSPNWILANSYIGEPVNIEDLLSIDSGKQFKLIDGNKVFCIGFIEFQYGQLSEKSPVHRKIIQILKGHKIPYQYPINRVQEEEEEKEKEKESAVVVDLEHETTYPIEKCLEIALKDERWVKANTTNKAELQQFNAALTGTGEYEKNPLDYKKHFHHWKKKGKLPEVVPKMQTGGSLAKIEAMLRGGGSG